MGAVWRLDIDGSPLRQLVKVRNDPDRPSYPRDPAWSSTGRIAFVLDELDDVEGDVGEVYKAWITVVDADGANLRQLELHGHSPAWSPDGQTLAFIRENDASQPGPVMLADADGANARRLRNGPYFAVAFSPNGRRMAFARYLDGVLGRIEIARNDGTTIKSIRAHDWRIMLALTWTRAPNR